MTVLNLATGILLLLGAPGPSAGDLGDRVPPPYRVSIEIRGEKSSELEELLLVVSTAAATRDDPPPTFALLEAVAQEDARKMEQVLRSRSFYGGTASGSLKSEKDRLFVAFLVTTG